MVWNALGATVPLSRSKFIAGSLEAGRRVELRGFGSFGLKERHAP